MCGRYSLFVPPTELGERFDLRSVAGYEPRYNAAPGQSLPVVTDGQPDSLQFMEWGLVPAWADSRDDGGHINARGETVMEKASFSDAFRKEADGPLAAGRCLVPADGFYEWTETDASKQPYRVTMTDGEPFAMAGLWAQWKPPTTQTGLGTFAGGDAETVDADVLETFTVVTTEPNDVVERLHHRMAVILPEDEQAAWLDASPRDALELLEPFPADRMRSYPVSTAVNDPANDSPAVVEKVSLG